MRRALQISGGDWVVFIEKPISLTLLVIAALSLGIPVLRRVWQRSRVKNTVVV